MAVDDLDIGTVLDGTYELAGKLGEGGMGVVWRAKHLRLPKQVAVKVLHSVMGADQEVYARFRREAEIASELGHPNIVEALDFNILDDGTPYLVLELLRGRSLRQALADGPLPIALALTLLSQIASGLRAAHRREIVHRDLKPENVFLCEHEDEAGARAVRAKILDFGISKMHNSKSLQTADGVLMGTPHYMAPEQASGGSVDARTDQFALAAIGYELLVGKPPFSADQPVQVLYQVVHTTPKAPSELRPELPKALDAVFARGLAKDPGERFADVAELVKQLWHASGMTAPSEALAALASLTGAGEAVARRSSAAVAAQEAGVAATIASQPPGSVPAASAGEAFAPTIDSSRQLGALRTGPPAARAEDPELAMAATIAQPTPQLRTGPPPPGGDYTTGPPAPAPARGNTLALAAMIALVAAALGGILVWLLVRNPDAPRGREATRGSAAATSATPDARSAALRADAMTLASTSVRADGSAPDGRASTSKPKPTKPKPTKPKPKPSKPKPSKPKPTKPKPKPKPTKPKPTKPAKAAPLSARLRSRVASAYRLLRQRNYRKANLTAERLMRELPSSHRWQAHHILTLGYCGLQELANVRANYEQLPRHMKKSTLARCKRLGTDFVP